MASDTEITKVRIVIRHLLWQIREVRKDRDAAWKWVNRFANTLQYQDLEQDPDQYALAILAEARSFNDQKKRNGQMKWVREQLAKEGVTNPTQEQLDEKWLEMYGNETTADAPTREDGEFKSGSGNAVNLESATPAKPSLAYSGKNGLVRLTDDEYALLLQELGNKRKADRLIDDLDYKLAEGATFRQPHLHVLTHWQSYREDKAAEAAEAAKSRAAANADAFGNVDRRTPFQKNQDELHQLYVLTSEKLKEVK